MRLYIVAGDYTDLALNKIDAVFDIDKLTMNASQLRHIKKDFMVRTIFLFILISALTGCENIAIWTTPPKKPKTSHSKLAKTSEQLFWQTLHAGDYDGIDKTLALMTAAYLQNPNDPVLASHLGFLHIWKITERARENTIPATIVNEIILSKRYFAEAILLDPNDPRIQGFYGDTQLIEGQLLQNSREVVRGFFTLRRAIKRWPEFNYFTAGYPMSVLPPTDKNFKLGLDYQWQTLTLCAGVKISAQNPDYSPYLHLTTTRGPKRACWNSWIAPHNFEGFFLNMGDMLVKAHDWQTAIKIYENAKLSPDFNQWPYKKFLEERIKNAQNNVYYFNQKNIRDKDHVILFNSGYGCAACHQK